MSLWTGIVSCILCRSPLIFHARQGISYLFCHDEVEVQKGHMPCPGSPSYQWLTRNLEPADCQACEHSTRSRCHSTGTPEFLFQLMDLISLVSSFFLFFLSHSCAPHAQSPLRSFVRMYTF